MSWSKTFEVESIEDLETQAVEHASRMTNAREVEQLRIAAAQAVVLARRIGAEKCFVQVNGHVEAEAGPGDGIGVYVSRR